MDIWLTFASVTDKLTIETGAYIGACKKQWYCYTIVERGLWRGFSPTAGLIRATSLAEVGRRRKRAAARTAPTGFPVPNPERHQSKKSVIVILGPSIHLRCP